MSVSGNKEFAPGVELFTIEFRTGPCLIHMFGFCSFNVWCGLNGSIFIARGRYANTLVIYYGLLCTAYILAVTL